MAILSRIAQIFKRAPQEAAAKPSLPVPQMREFNFRPLFKSPQLQAEFERDGYVVIKQKMISDEDIREMRSIFEEVLPKDSLGTMYSNTYDVQDEAFNERVDRKIREVFENSIADMFDECVLAAGTILAKGTGDKSSSNLHQDWNNVDENKHTSLSIWAPLIDVDEHNGCLWVVPGSHLLPYKIRSFTQPSVFVEFDEKLAPYIVPVPLKAGEAIIFAHNTFHGSKPNQSDNIRVAVLAGVLPRETEIVHYHREVEGEPMKVLKAGMDFYYRYMRPLINGERQLGLPVIEEVHEVPAPYTSEEAIHDFSYLPRFAAHEQN